MVIPTSLSKNRDVEKYLNVSRELERQNPVISPISSCDSLYSTTTEALSLLQPLPSSSFTLSLSLLVWGERKEMIVWKIWFILLFIHKIKCETLYTSRRGNIIMVIGMGVLTWHVWVVGVEYKIRKPSRHLITVLEKLYCSGFSVNTGLVIDRYVIWQKLSC